jgi:lysyl-tRNA synthetase class 2
MMNRDEFLLQVWAPFPSADDGWIDVATFLNEGEGLVCGRLSGGADRWQLESGGAKTSLRFSGSCTWLKPQGKGDVEFRSELLAPGDLVCVQLSAAEASACLLLVPTGKEWNLKSNFSVQRSEKWTSFTQVVRGFFQERGFIEAQTPTLVPSPGTEPFLDPFTTDWEVGSQCTPLFLPTSPEFHLKKMLAAGWTQVFELKSCFRNGEIGAHHQPEFTMLEWYRAYANLDSIAADAAALIAECAESLCPALSVPGLKKTTMAELFAKVFGGFKLRPTTSREELLALAEKAQVRIDVSDTWDEVFFRLFLEKIEPWLGSDGPLLVRGYPPSQAALSRIGEDGFADRFEIYWRGLELANAFHELNDPVENRKRFEQDAAGKIALRKKPVPVDEELLKALDYGLPPSGGIALGLDRLFMALFEIDSIEETRAFPLKAQGH